MDYNGDYELTSTIPEKSPAAFAASPRSITPDPREEEELFSQRGEAQKIHQMVGNHERLP